MGAAADQRGQQRLAVLGIVLVQEASGVIKPLAGNEDVLSHGHVLAASYKLIDALEARLKPLSITS